MTWQYCKPCPPAARTNKFSRRRHPITASCRLQGRNQERAGCEAARLPLGVSGAGAPKTCFDLVHFSITWAPQPYGVPQTTGARSPLFLMEFFLGLPIIETSWRRPSAAVSCPSPPVPTPLYFNDRFLFVDKHQRTGPIIQQLLHKAISVT